jgi:dihydroceramide fatty acyl 2-hydroxylase
MLPTMIFLLARYLRKHPEFISKLNVMKYSTYVIQRYNSVALRIKCFIASFAIIIPILLISIPIRSEWPIAFFMLLLFGGWLCWTFTEYMIHRFWTHTESGHSNEKSRFKSHLHHHTHPTEISITGWQRFFFISIGAALIFVAVMFNNYFTLVTGFFIGFAWSFVSHWILHQRWSRKLFPRLHYYHICHHCKHADKCFGFSTTIWDRLLGTTPPKKSKISERIIEFYFKK